MLQREIKELKDQTAEISIQADTFTRDTFDAFIGRINQILQRHEGK